MAGNQMRHQRGVLRLRTVVDERKRFPDSRTWRSAVGAHPSKWLGTRSIGFHPDVVTTSSDGSSCGDNVGPQPSEVRTSRHVPALASEPGELEFLHFSLPLCLVNGKSGEGILT
jgi:hypothetical protein